MDSLCLDSQYEGLYFVPAETVVRLRDATWHQEVIRRGEELGVKLNCSNR